MAESIVRLRVDSKEYDSRLRNAAQGLQRLESQLHDAGKSFSDASKEQIAYARALGDMATKCTSAKGKVGELTAAFTDLSLQYRRMTDEEKRGEYGKALSASLDKIKERIQESKEELNDINASLNDTGKQSDSAGSALGSLADKFGLNITKLGAMGAALGAATLATKVAKDAFFANEEQLDAWGRTVEASESVYRGFLNALNNGDISSFLRNISTIVDAARDAYNALDELATYNAFNQINVERTRHNLSESINDYREGTGSKENVRTAGDAAVNELKTLREKQRDAYKKAVTQLARERGVSPKDLYDILSGDYGTYEQIKGTKMTGKRTVVYGGGMFGGGGSYEVAAPRTRQEQLGQALRKINDTGELDRIQALGAQVERTGYEIEGIEKQVFRALNARTGTGGGGGRVTTTGRGGGGGGNTHQLTPAERAQQIVDAANKQYAETILKADMRMEAGLDDSLAHQRSEMKAQEGLMDAYARASALYDSPDLKNSFTEAAQEYQRLAKAVKDTEEEQKRTNEYLTNANFDMNKGSSQASMEDIVRQSIAASNMDADSAAMGNLLEHMIRNGLDTVNFPTAELQQMMAEGMDIPDEKWQEIIDKINAQLAALGLEPIELDVETGNIAKVAKQASSSWGDAARAIQAAGGALQQLENPTAKIAGMIGEAVANIALGFAQASSKEGGKGIWAWIAATAAGLGTMITTISAIKSATAGSYAEGGIIPGHNYSDGLIANVSSGELILNRAQQGVIANQLQGGLSDLHLETSFSTEEIRISLNNNSRRRGHGEYVTSR